ncbi:type III toxin-antitoxin system ToxN/AbiQ family toxin [Lysinibacillus sp. NPDC097287]|uniref:type III toxin-antitoxin system ToxN/AbiQ family toxin n=1 Tax=Lysinibacillus sp. NPDC097287 TaxID=3364144 RepID=UPI003823BD02
MKLNFYDVNEEYLKYLQDIDGQVPNVVEGGFTKFFCGIVLEVNGFKYLAPVTSFKRQQGTNLLIKSNNGKVHASIRFCFMIPVNDEVITKKDFKDIKDTKYVGLLSTELNACRKMQQDILDKAEEVYRIGSTPEHSLNYTCCDFLRLEKALEQYSQ